MGLEIDKPISSDFRTLTVTQKAKRGIIQPYLKTKNGIREVDLCPSLAAMLKEYVGLRTSGLLFCTSTGAQLLQANTLQDSLHPILDVIVGIGFATDAPHNLDGELGKGIFSWLIAIAMTFIAIVLYRHSIRRLRSLPMAWSVVEIILAGFLLFCAGFVGILGFAAAHGGPHAFPADLRIGMVCWLIALAMTIIAIVWFRRSSRRLRSLRELRLHEFRSVLGKR